MPRPMSDLREAILRLEAQGFALAITDFSFNEIVYFVLIKRYTKGKPNSERYALARLEFVPKSDMGNSKEWPANSAGLVGFPKEIRAFFSIPYAEGQVGDALKNLYEHLGSALLTNFRMRPRSEEQSLFTASLSRSDSEDPARIHCFTARHNPKSERTGKPEQRSPFNSQKAATLRPALYERLKNDPGISFLFSTDPLRERTDKEIYESFVHS